MHFKEEKHLALTEGENESGPFDRVSTLLSGTSSIYEDVFFILLLFLISSVLITLPAHYLINL